jgi:hypothetical protein
MPYRVSRTTEVPVMKVVRNVALAVMLLSTSAAAQWLKYPTPGIPRTADGRPNLSAPAPRLADGKPDISGLWLTRGIYIGDIARDLKEPVPYRPWAAELYKKRRAEESKDDPTGRCVPGGVPRSTAVPYPFKILHATNGMVVILYEAVHAYRQIFTDGRPHPKDPNPNWLGYSVGRWEKDTLVVETTGFVENSWLDNFGKPGTEQMRVTERFTRKDFGSMNVEVTIDDPKAYTKPWTVTLPLVLQPDTEMLEYICPENEKDYDRLTKPTGGR